MASFPLLEEREENEIHSLRLLAVEERPFKRVTKRLLTPGTLLQTTNKLPTPPPDSLDQSSLDTERQRLLEERRQFREDVLIDFALFDDSIARLQFLHNSNARERERYKTDKQRILDASQAVRDNTAQLRLDLEVAKVKLEQRKEYDAAANKIYDNTRYKSREDTEVQLEKLTEECRVLEEEIKGHGETWKARREQFGRLIDEGNELRRQIRDEKEEVERREGMDGGEEDGEVGEAGSRGGQTPRHNSENATPGPDGGVTEGGLKPRGYASGSLSRPGSRATSRAPSPAFSERKKLNGEMPESGLHEETTVDEDAMVVDGVGDTPMADTPAEAPTPQVVIDEPSEEGEEEEEGEHVEKMDMS